MIEIWSDGSSTGRSDREGGWSFIITQDGLVAFADYAGDPHTTNNIMELSGALHGIEKLASSGIKRPGEEVVLISDSQYTLGLATGQYSPSKNVEIATKLRELYTKWCTGIKWVRGHQGEPLNERCDSLAKRGKAEAALLSKGDTNGRPDGEPQSD